MPLYRRQRRNGALCLRAGVAASVVVLALGGPGLRGTGRLGLASHPVATARTRLLTLVRQRSASSTSVAAVDLHTGTSVSAGATSGMTTASVVKVELLETLLLQHQRRHTYLTNAQDAAATAMIEHSNNSAAEQVFWYDGGRSGVKAAEKSLGLSTTRTVPGSSDYWGLTTTSATQQLVLLRNLVSSHGPIDARGRAYALNLLRHVEADQTWGVPAAADHGTRFAVKNGWLSVSRDDNLWAVNSVGVITAHGHTVVVAVMTQHDSGFSPGISRVQTLAKAAVAVVTS